MSSHQVLKVENLLVDYALASGAKLRAVDGVSFNLANREILGIVGESGSGKSTVGMVVAGFVQASGGNLVFGEDLVSDWTRAPKWGRRGIQMIFQDSASALNPKMTVGHIVAEAISGGRRITSKHVEGSKDYLVRTGLSSDLVNRKPAELSGGQRQRVAIARALAAKPRVLVCDESVAALDVSARAKILNLLVEIRDKEDISILFISHDLAVVSQLVDRLIVMQHGVIVEEGPTRPVIDQPEHPYTKKLLAAIPELERKPAL